MTSPSPSRVLLIGWDAADWKLIDPMLARGELPALEKFISTGVRGNLATLMPTLSPLLWTSIATGKTADKHGVLGFVEPAADGTGLRLASSTSRKTKALWNIVSQSGLPSVVISWYASHPAEPIDGVCVSNLFQENAPRDGSAWPVPSGAVHPGRLADTVADLRLRPDEVLAPDLAMFIPRLDRIDRHDERPHLMARMLAQCSSVHNVATALLRQEPWRFAAVFYELIDTAGHHFMQFHPPRMAHVGERDFALYSGVMAGVYRFHDMMLDTLMQIVGDDTTVLIVSDHGFHSDHLRPSGTGRTSSAAADATWHRPLGVLAMRGPGLKQGDRVYGANILDVAPTVLTLLGLPVGADMDGRVLVEAWSAPPKIDRVFGWDGLEGDAGLHPPDLRQDPFEAREAMRQLADLGYIQPLSGDAERDLKAVADDTRFNLAVVYLTTRRPSESLPILEELHAATPGDARVTTLLAQCYADLGRFGDVTATLQPLLESGAAGGEARVLSAAALIAQNRLDEALAALQHAENTDQSNVVRCLLGDVYIAMSRWPDAERMYRQAAAGDPDDARAHQGIGLALLAQQRFEEAADACLQALELQHFLPAAHYYLGVALAWMKEYPHAIRSFQVALSMQPGYLDAHRYLASIYRLLKDGANAAKHRDIAIRLLSDQRRSQKSPEDLVRSVPLGPIEWSHQSGAGDDPAIGG